jgi:hypothetical protein
LGIDHLSINKVTHELETDQDFPLALKELVLEVLNSFLDNPRGDLGISMSVISY